MVISAAAPAAAGAAAGAHGKTSDVAATSVLIETADDAKETFYPIHFSPENDALLDTVVNHWGRIAKTVDMPTLVGEIYNFRDVRRADGKGLQKFFKLSFVKTAFRQYRSTESEAMVRKALKDVDARDARLVSKSPKDKKSDPIDIGSVADRVRPTEQRLLTMALAEIEETEGKAAARAELAKWHATEALPVDKAVHAQLDQHLTNIHLIVEHAKSTAGADVEDLSDAKLQADDDADLRETRKRKTIDEDDDESSDSAGADAGAATPPPLKRQKVDALVPLTQEPVPLATVFDSRAAAARAVTFANGSVEPVAAPASAPAAAAAAAPVISTTQRKKTTTVNRFESATTFDVEAFIDDIIVGLA